MADRKLYVVEVNIQRTNGRETNRHEWVVADDIQQAETYATSLAAAMEAQDHVTAVTVTQLRQRQVVWVAPETP